MEITRHCGPYQGIGERLVVAFDIGDPNLFV